jgi:hypothetical protein
VLVVGEERGTAFRQPGRSDGLDTLASSPRCPDLKNNNFLCSVSENVSKRRVVPMAPPPAAQTDCLLIPQDPMHF